MVLLMVGIALVMCPCKGAEEAEKRRQIIEEMAKRLAEDRRVDSQQLRSERKASSEDDDDASFENVEY